LSDTRIIIVGAGPAGYVAAIRAAQLGAEVSLIEAAQVGGTCLNWGCIPTKSLLASTETLSLIRGAKKLGIEVEGIKLNFTRMMERKNGIVSQLRKGVEYLLKANKVKLVRGKASFLNLHRIEVKTNENKEKIEGDSTIMATGSKPILLPFIDFNHPAVLTSETTLELAQIPQSLLIVGAGVIGCEFASIFGPLGTQITMVEMMDRILPQEDKRISLMMKQILEKRGIKIFTDTRLEEITDYEKDGLTARLDNGERISTEKMLVCVGRSPYTEGLGLENLDLRLDQKGNITVNERMQTSEGRVYAIGDENALGLDSKINYTSIPNCIFTSPQIGTVGLTLDKAREEGIEAKIGRFPFSASGKAQALGEIDGFVQLVVDEEDGKILGGQIIGPHAADLVHEISLAVRWELTVDEIGSTVHAHPTLSEAIMEAAKKAQGKPIHLT